MNWPRPRRRETRQRWRLFWTEELKLTGRTVLDEPLCRSVPSVTAHFLPLTRVSSGGLTQSFQMANAGINPYYYYYFYNRAIRDLYLYISLTTTIIIIIFKKERKKRRVWKWRALLCLWKSRIFTEKKQQSRIPLVYCKSCNGIRL